MEYEKENIFLGTVDCASTLPRSVSNAAARQTSTCTNPGLELSNLDPLNPDTRVFEACRDSPAFPEFQLIDSGGSWTDHPTFDACSTDEWVSLHANIRAQRQQMDGVYANLASEVEDNLLLFESTNSTNRCIEPDWPHTTVDSTPSCWGHSARCNLRETIASSPQEMKIRILHVLYPDLTIPTSALPAASNSVHLAELEDCQCDLIAEMFQICTPLPERPEQNELSEVPVLEPLSPRCVMLMPTEKVAPESRRIFFGFRLEELVKHLIPRSTKPQVVAGN